MIKQITFRMFSINSKALKTERTFHFCGDKAIKNWQCFWDNIEIWIKEKEWPAEKIKIVPIGVNKQGNTLSDNKFFTEFENMIQINQRDIDCFNFNLVDIFAAHKCDINYKALRRTFYGKFEDSYDAVKHLVEDKTGATEMDAFSSYFKWGTLILDIVKSGKMKNWGGYYFFLGFNVKPYTF